MKTQSIKWAWVLSIIINLTLTFCTLGVTSAHAAGILYVTSTGTGDCSSWANACTLQTALTSATSGDEIWVAAGMHTPTTATDRDATFQLKNGVAVYGGFAGIETARDQRDPAVNPTILSGELGAADNSDNSYHVVTGANYAILDGFTITAGNANGFGCPGACGGGVYNASGSNLTLSNLIVSGNSALDYGGGMYNTESNPILMNVTFSDNSALNYGGGMYNHSSNPILTNVTFGDNLALDYGGGMYNYSSSPTLMNVTFSSNPALVYGGGMYNNSSSPTLTNVTFSRNSAYNGGGAIYNTSDSSPTLTNVTISKNSASQGGGIYNNSNSDPTIVNTILWSNTAPNGGAQIYNDSSITRVSSSIIQNGCPAGSICTDIIGLNPGLGSLGDYGGFTQTIPLTMRSSSAIDTGNNSTCPATDQRGVTRPQGPHCDIGAYEYEHYAGPYYVKPVTSGSGNCQSWENACTLQTALSSTLSGDEIWVAAGTHKPTTGSSRYATISLKNGVGIYGGFAGAETARVQRNPAVNLTILSGDLNGNDNNNVSLNEPTRADNSYHVAIGTTGAILDGFTITAGNANGSSGYTLGGGMYNSWDNSPTLTNVTFSNNSASSGGGMYNYWNSNPTLTNVTFSSNSADYGGGGMYNYSSSPMLTNVTFSANSAGIGVGGGINNTHNSSPTLTNVTFSNNSAYGGGGMYNAGSSPTLVNVTFSVNFATGEWIYGGGGGGMYNTAGSPTLTNVTFSGNSARYGGGISNSVDGRSQIRNTIFWGNTAPDGGAQIGGIATLSDSIVQDGCPTGSTCTNIITGDPLLGTLGNYGGFTQTIPLLAGSSAINTGNDAVCPATDQRGMTRPQGAHCDIGAYEYKPLPFSDILLMNSGAWNKYDFTTGGYLGGVWTGTAAGCLPALIDYDGDGAKEYSQLCGGAWHFYNKDGSYNKGIWVGDFPGSVPVPGDYNGDGMDEPILFYAGAWHYFDFATSAYDAALSRWTGTAPGCVPAPLDYNGDGKMKFSLFCGGPWHFYNSDGSYNKGVWIGGSTSNLPVPADYDGNGTEDVVLFANGVWHFFDFATGMYNGAKSTYTGLPDPSAKPAPIDYSKDGSLDFVQYANGTWYFYNANGSLNKSIATGSPASALPMSRRFLP